MVLLMFLPGKRNINQILLNLQEQEQLQNIYRAILMLVLIHECRYWLVVRMHSVRHVSTDHEGAWCSLLEGCDVGGGGGQTAKDELGQVGLGTLSALWPHLQAT